MNVKITILSAAVALGALVAPMAAQAQVPYKHPDNLNQRFRDQNARIKQGFASGQLTRREAYHDRSRLDKVRMQDMRDRAYQHGHLTPGERIHQNNELNRNSAAIYRTKHNDRVR